MFIFSDSLRRNKLLYFFFVFLSFEIVAYFNIYCFNLSVGCKYQNSSVFILQFQHFKQMFKFFALLCTVMDLFGFFFFKYVPKMEKKNELSHNKVTNPSAITTGCRYQLCSAFYCISHTPTHLQVCVNRSESRNWSRFLNPMLIYV